MPSARDLVPAQSPRGAATSSSCYKECHPPFESDPFKTLVVREGVISETNEGRWGTLAARLMSPRPAACIPCIHRSLGHGSRWACRTWTAALTARAVPGTQVRIAVLPELRCRLGEKGSFQSLRGGGETLGFDQQCPGLHISSLHRGKSCMRSSSMVARPPTAALSNAGRFRQGRNNQVVPRGAIYGGPRSLIFI